MALTCTQIWWTSDVGMAFARLEEGYDNALKEYFRKQVSQLNTLISMLVGQLTPGDRQKVMTICTIDVHARDVVAKMISQKVKAGGEGSVQSSPPGPYHLALPFLLCPILFRREMSLFLLSYRGVEKYTS